MKLKPNTLYNTDSLALLTEIAMLRPKLIIADPIYSEYWFYSRLQLLANTNACPNIFAFTNSLHLLPCAKVADLNARVLTVHKQTHGALSGSTIEKAYHVFWMGSQKTKGQSHKLPDSWVSNTWPARYPTTHKWTKNPEYIAKLIEACTDEGDLVLDPCMGSGLSSYVAKEMNRQFIGIEKDAETFYKASGIVANAQPMQAFDAEQGALELEGV